MSALYIPLLLAGAIAQIPSAVYAMTHPRRVKGQPLTDQAKAWLSLSLVGAIVILIGVAIMVFSRS